MKDLPQIRNSWLPYSRQWVDQKDIDGITDVLKSDWLTQGPKVKEFEKEFADFVGAKFAIAFSNGTEALVAAHRAVNIGPGDETITTPMTFAATANAALLVGGKPIFCDIELHSGLMDPKELEKKVTSKTKAILPVHYAGGCCDMDAINEIAKKSNAVVIEDACHAPGATYKSRPTGSLADMSVFSFHPVKPIATGEGGMVTTNNPDFASSLRALATHGIFKDDSCSKVGPWYYEMRLLGSNSRMSELHGALALSQLKKSSLFLQCRRDFAERYDWLFSKNDFFIPIKIPDFTKSAYHLYPVLARMDNLSCDKKTLIESLHKMNIGVQVHYIPVHRHPIYRNMGYTDAGLKNSVAFYERIISLPLFAAMTENDQDDVIEALNVIVERYGNRGPRGK